MAKKIDSQKQLLEHSKAKVELLGAYLDRYLNVISNDSYTPKILIFDLFCGEGRYENKGKGSPLIIIDKINNLHQINKAKNDNIPPIDLFLNDKSRKKTNKLKNIIQTEELFHKDFGKIAYSNIEYKEIVERIANYLQTLSKEKAFIFIDPYGYKDISATDIKSLLKNKNSEVLLFLPTQFMYRFDKKGTPKALVDFISEITDYENWETNSSVWTFIEQLEIGFRDYLGLEYFVDTFTIEKNSTTVFCLFFFSSHIRGFEKMIETKWALDLQKGKGWSYEKTGDLFAEQENNELENKLIEYIKVKRRYNGDIYEFTLRNGYSPKHTTEIFKNLQNRNKLFTFTEENTKIRKGAFYVNYKNYRNNYKKIYFKIKE